MSLKVARRVFTSGLDHTTLFSLAFKTSSGTRLVRTFLGVLLLAFATAFICIPQPAWAEGGVQCTGIWLNGESWQSGDTVASEVDPKPRAELPLDLCTVFFDKNVSYAEKGTDDSFVQRNEGRIHLVYADGSEVENYYITSSNLNDDRRCFYILTTDWLNPLTEYRIVVDPGIEAKNGEDISDEEYVFTFKTSPQLSIGLSVYQVIIGIIVVLFIAIGVVVSALRIRRKRR